MLGIAFKEWAAVCAALASGRQAIILRKGGIAEDGGSFRPEHSRFWLYPTHFHEARQPGLKPEFLPLLEEAEANRPLTGTLRLTHFCEVAAVHRATDLERVLALDPFHVWTPETIEQRFHYRTPGLFVLLVRVYSADVVEVPERPVYAGCKTWVHLEPPVAIAAETPVLTTDRFEEIAADLATRLGGISPRV